jgi:hypothetical protein
VGIVSHMSANFYAFGIAGRSDVISLRAAHRQDIHLVLLPPVLVPLPCFAGKQGIGIIAACQAVLMGGPEYARYAATEQAGQDSSSLSTSVTCCS